MSYLIKMTIADLVFALLFVAAVLAPAFIR